ncbi:MAG: hypothetical protein EOO22_02885 [Comamonadaceae bacterium]|nr:MAG: hypothetical protein EOO22_02885 [Comamonadaceae bacterium]
MNFMTAPRLGLLGTLLGGLLAMASADADAALPDIRRIDGIETLGGGRSRDEAHLLAEVAPRWAVSLEFGRNRRSVEPVPVDVELTVRGQSSGAVVLSTRVGGPRLLLRLPAGVYEVEAKAGGLSLAQTISVQETGSVHARFLWPSNMDFRPAGRSGVEQARATTD